MSQLEIATDLGNKRWTALNKIYEDGEKHNANWCKRMAQQMVAQTELTTAEAIEVLAAAW